MIQARTKGNPGSKAQSDQADTRAASLAPILTKLRAGGVTSPRALAAALTARNIPTPSGRGSWSAQRVRRVLKRIARSMKMRSDSGAELPVIRARGGEC